MPRDKLTKLKVLHRNIAGANTLVNNMSGVVVGSNTFFDPTQATASITVSNCVFAAGDTCVVFVADNLAGGGSSGPTTCTVGGSGTTLIVGTTQNDQTAACFTRSNITAGSKSVVVGTWGANPTACAAVVVAVSGAKSVSSTDGFSSGEATTAAFDTGLTSALLFANEFAIAAVGSQNTDLVGGITWDQGFLNAASGHVGTHSGGPPNDTVLDVAFLKLLSNSPIKATGTLPQAVDNASIIVTIKPA